jgi:hypothetical protein
MGGLMKRVSVVAIILVSLAGIALSQVAQLGRTAAPSTMAAGAGESPLACDREALTAEQRKRHFEDLGLALLKLRKSARELPDGFEFEFPGDRATYAMLSEWVDGERVCCPFFDITLRSDREGGPVHLRLTGRAGVKQFIEVGAKEWIKESAVK